MEQCVFGKLEVPIFISQKKFQPKKQEYSDNRKNGKWMQFNLKKSKVKKTELFIVWRYNSTLLDIPKEVSLCYQLFLACPSTLASFFYF